MLKKIYSKAEVIPFYHWGDIDLGGFGILTHLRRETGISFKAYNMDLETLKANKENAMKIDDNIYINKLNGLLENEEYVEFRDVIEYMAQERVRLEQEGLDLNI